MYNQNILLRRTFHLTRTASKNIDSRSGVSLVALAGFITSSVFVWGMIRHDGRFVRDIMKMSPTYGETATTAGRARHLPIHFYACLCTCTRRYKMHTRVHTGVPTRNRTRVRTHRRCTHYLMALTYVFAVSRSLREQSESFERISTKLVLFLSSSLSLSLFLSYAVYT